MAVRADYGRRSHPRSPNLPGQPSGQNAVSARSLLIAEEAPQPNVSLVVQQRTDVDCGISDNSRKWKLSTRENHRMFGKRKKS
jgi:hypothetical protein